MRIGPQPQVFHRKQQPGICKNAKEDHQYAFKNEKIGIKLIQWLQEADIANTQHQHKNGEPDANMSFKEHIYGIIKIQADQHQLQDIEDGIHRHIVPVNHACVKGNAFRNKSGGYQQANHS